MKTRWKFLRLVGNKIKSNSGDLTWKIDEWKHEDTIYMCNKGLHCSKGIYQAFTYVQGEVLALVEVKGKREIQNDKEVYSDMRILKAYEWQKKDSVELSIYCAELCLDNFEKEYPKDKRPREAIEAAKNWIKKPTKKNESAARSAAVSAWSAAESAWSAAWSAWSAARSAAGSAAVSAWSAARSAAWSAESAVLQSIEDWFLDRVDILKPLNP